MEISGALVVLVVLALLALVSVVQLVVDLTDLRGAPRPHRSAPRDWGSPTAPSVPPAAARWSARTPPR